MTSERYQLPLFERENLRYDIVPPIGTNCRFYILFETYKHNFIQRDLFYLWVERYSTEHFLIQ